MSVFEGHCLNKPKENTGISIAKTINDSRGHTTCKKKDNLKVLIARSVRIAAFSKIIVLAKKSVEMHELRRPRVQHLPNSKCFAKNPSIAIMESQKAAIEQSLYMMKYVRWRICIRYIKEIGLDEFYCIYCSPMQVAILYKQQIKNVKKQQSMHLAARRGDVTKKT